MTARAEQVADVFASSVDLLPDLVSPNLGVRLMAHASLAALHCRLDRIRMRVPDALNVRPDFEGPMWSGETVSLVVSREAVGGALEMLDWRKLSVGDAVYRYAPGFVGNKDNVLAATVRAIVDDGVVLLRFWSRGRQRWEYETEQGSVMHIRWRKTREAALAARDDEEGPDACPTA